jgi:hypothetical protein
VGSRRVNLADVLQQFVNHINADEANPYTLVLDRDIFAIELHDGSSEDTYFYTITPGGKVEIVGRRKV